MQEGTAKKKHSINLENRGVMDIGGVCEVASFDEVSVVLLTEYGELNVEGSELKIGVLDTERGVVSLTGKVDAVYYNENREKKRPLFSKRQK